VPLSPAVWAGAGWRGPARASAGLAPGSSKTSKKGRGFNAEAAEK
jgi:hypothetical protein